MTPALSVRGLEAQYGAFKALHGLDFDIPRGSVTTLLGANGAGKTTTLRALCGMIRRSGVIEFGGRSIARMKTEDIVRLGIAHVPEGRGTFTTVTVEENLQLGAMVRNSRDGVADDLARIYALFPRLKERSAQQAGTLSGGEQQMLAIGRALMLRPKLMLLDEPSFGLAPLAVQEVFSILHRYPRQYGGQHASGRAERLAGAGTRRPGLSHRDRLHCAVRPGRRDPRRRVRCEPPTSATDGNGRMETFIQQVLAGIATGGIYACMALAIVMIYQAIHHLNFAQGEMAMFSTFISWQLLQWGVPYWLAFALTIAIAFAGGFVIARTIFKPIENAPVLSHIVVFIALFAIFNSLAGFVWDFTIKPFPSPFGNAALFGEGLIGAHQAGMIVVTLVVLALLLRFFAIRASAWQCAPQQPIRNRHGWSESASAG